ncbi:hypothetical protein M0M57_15740 [Flavobacterium azooxidireducens]|uniref:Uncharacterized protein n=1 Tax=Flavobacterium azooxidireducens TaxID=1871076 RepID=A0ABY4KE32_9FLAO|nr:hypothetical protein [Flavobacterium azooxidireducens]UPQ79059.1 hypothetical protein M0M57_15740 [Flavobacterium azooxidireducens]
MKRVCLFLIIFFLFPTKLLLSQSYSSVYNLEEYNQIQVPLDSIRYYYYPNLQAYFDTHKKEYIYKKSGEWIREKSIPNDYRGYSLFNKNYEIINGLVNEDNPEKHIETHKDIYPQIFTAKEMRKKLEKIKQNALTYN